MLEGMVVIASRSAAVGHTLEQANPELQVLFQTLLLAP